jgi:hypothetical protein
LILISKEELSYLKEQGYLKLVRGKYPNLFISSKNKSSKRKKYYIPELDVLMNAIGRGNGKPKFPKKEIR